jgi:two-component system, LuxR family, sensor kinase FixL
LRLAAAGEMAAALAHELNQPLAALSAYASACDLMLKRNTDKEQLHETIRRMVREANRAANVVSRLRDFFRSGATHMERIGLNDLIRAVTDQFSEKAQRCEIDLIVGRAPDDLVLLGDRLQLEVVLRNLLANAFDALAETVDQPRTIRLAVQQELGNRVSICVEDNGPGPDSDISDRIFEPFVTNKSSGLGLGLAISRAIAESHGGTLLSKLGNHGAFRLTLPTELNRKD